MAQNLPPPPPVPQTGLKTQKDIDAWARAITQYLDQLRQSIGNLLP